MGLTQTFNSTIIPHVEHKNYTCKKATHTIINLGMEISGCKEVNSILILVKLLVMMEVCNLNLWVAIKASLESHHVWHPTFHILQAHEFKSSGTLSPSEEAPKYSGKPCKIVPSPIDDHLGELKSMDHQPSIYLCAKVQS
jgi:hypothetical protein